MCVGWDAILNMKVTGTWSLPSKPTNPPSFVYPVRAKEGKDVKGAALFEFLPPKKPIDLEKQQSRLGGLDPWARKVLETTTTRLSKNTYRVASGGLRG
jgi:hypothetical protein